MLSESDVEERAQYCRCVFLQLSRLYSRDLVEPSRYLEYLNRSSLGLGKDQFITETIQDSLESNQPDAGLLSLITLYEGFTYAYCEVLEKSLEEIEKTLPPGLLEQLAEEMEGGE